MKTPREILLGRHEGMETKLNAVRARALDGMAPPARNVSWREWIASLRWHWVGLSAVWVAVLVLKLDSGGLAKTAVARGNVVPAHVLTADLIRNQRELIELTESPVIGVSPILPPRRSENKMAEEVV